MLGGVQQVLLVVQQLDEAGADLAAHQRADRPAVLLAQQAPLLLVLAHLPLLHRAGAGGGRGRGEGGRRVVESRGHPHRAAYSWKSVKKETNTISGTTETPGVSVETRHAWHRPLSHSVPFSTRNDVICEVSVASALRRDASSCLASSGSPPCLWITLKTRISRELATLQSFLHLQQSVYNGGIQQAQTDGQQRRVVHGDEGHLLLLLLARQYHAHHVALRQ